MKSQTIKIKYLILIFGLIVIAVLMFGCSGVTSENSPGTSGDTITGNDNSTGTSGQSTIADEQSLHDLSGTILFTKSIFDPGQTRARQTLNSMSPDGDNEIEIEVQIEGEAYNREINFSRDCSYLLLVVNDKYINDPGPETIVIMNLDGSEERELTPPGIGRIRGITYSKNDQLIAYLREAELYIIDMEGNLVQSFPVPEYSGSLTWSPDGSHFAFISEDDLRNHRYVYVINSDGTNLINLTGEFDSDVIYRPYSPSWSPESDKLAFRAGNLSDSIDGIWIAQAPFTSCEKLWAPSLNESWSSVSLDIIAWSPDGEAIAFSTQPGNEVGAAVDIGMISIPSLKSKLVYRGHDIEKLIGWLSCDEYPAVLGQPDS